MTSLQYTLRQLAHSSWRRSMPYFNMQSAGLKFKVPATTPDAARLVRDWSLSWKTPLFQEMLEQNSGAFIDIGANIGQTLLDFLAARKNGEPYFGFEPNPKSNEALNRMIAANHITGANVLPIGLSNRNRLMQFFSGIGDETDKGATLREDIRPGKDVASIWVPCYRFDDVVDSAALGKIGAIKIDVEGAELEVLEGMSDTLATVRPPILCEILHRDTHAAKEPYLRRLRLLETLIASHRYIIKLIVPNGDATAVEHTETVSEFPDAVYSQSSLCDYLLLPEEKRELL